MKARRESVADLVRVMTLTRACLCKRLSIRDRVNEY